jgi:DNA polymerase-3 subunit alpha (Gram-positive type)
MGDSICEIGAFRIRERQVVDKFHSLINPKKSIPHEAYLIHKISDNDVKDAPYLEGVAEKFLSFIKDSVVCAYNVEFDLGFLNYEFKKINMPTIELPALDVLRMARKTLRLSRYNLETIASFFNIECAGLHRAVADSFVAFQIFLKLKDILKEKRLERLDDFISLYGLNNNVFKLKEETKVLSIKEAMAKHSRVSIRYFSYDNIMKKEEINPINLSLENKNYYLWCQNDKEQNWRINLSHVLDIEIV